MNHTIRGPCWCQGCEKKREKGNDKKWDKWVEKVSRPENREWINKALIELATAANTPLTEEQFAERYPAEAAAMAARQAQPSQQSDEQGTADNPDTSSRATTTSSEEQHLPDTSAGDTLHGASP